MEFHSDASTELVSNKGVGRVKGPYRGYPQTNSDRSCYFFSAWMNRGRGQHSQNSVMGGLVHGTFTEGLSHCQDHREGSWENIPWPLSPSTLWPPASASQWPNPARSQQARKLKGHFKELAFHFFEQDMDLGLQTETNSPEWMVIGGWGRCVPWLPRKNSYLGIHDYQNIIQNGRVALSASHSRCFGVFCTLAISLSVSSFLPLISVRFIISKNAWANGISVQALEETALLSREWLFTAMDIRGCMCPHVVPPWCTCMQRHASGINVYNIFSLHLLWL